MPKKSVKITSRGALLVVDLEAVDRVWTGMPAREVIDGIRAGTLAPRTPSKSPPFPPAEKKLVGLDVALASFTTKGFLDKPLAEGLVAKRALGIPWRWFSPAPEAREETRTDERLLTWAEIARVPDLSFDEILAISSAVEREMVGASEVKEAFARWSSREFAAVATTLPDVELAARLREAWDGDLAPLLAALGYDEEPELLAAVIARFHQVRAAIAFATTERYPVVPFLREPFDAWLAERARARAATRSP